VGDGVIVLDAATRVRYASPNAVSALHRVGVSANAIGQTLAELGVAETAARNAYERKEPVIEEIEQTTEVTLLTRSIPLLRQLKDDVEVTGGVLLLRDVSELRRRDRLLLTKDATIREIHHRVKNNLQTISSLLRLQGRRLTSPEAKEAVAESVRRIRTIALVHETLSREPGEDISFIEIVRPLMRLVEEGLQSADRPVTFQAKGDGGRLPATIATPLSVVILGQCGRRSDGGSFARRRRVTDSSGQQRHRAELRFRLRQSNRARAFNRPHTRNNRTRWHYRDATSDSSRRCVEWCCDDQRRSGNGS
jgi:two-component sensor histidine kinase